MSPNLQIHIVFQDPDGSRRAPVTFAGWAVKYRRSWVHLRSEDGKRIESYRASSIFSIVIEGDEEISSNWD